MYAPVSPLPKESPPDGVTVGGHFVPPGTSIIVSLGVNVANFNCNKKLHVPFCWLLIFSDVAFIKNQRLWVPMEHV